MSPEGYASTCTKYSAPGCSCSGSGSRQIRAGDPLPDDHGPVVRHDANVVVRTACHLGPAKLRRFTPTALPACGTSTCRASAAARRACVWQGARDVPVPRRLRPDCGSSVTAGVRPGPMPPRPPTAAQIATVPLRPLRYPDAGLRQDLVGSGLAPDACRSRLSNPTSARQCPQSATWLSSSCRAAASSRPPST